MSGAGDRSTLSMPSFDEADDMDDFTPRETSSAAPAPVAAKKVIDDVSRFPSREASPDAQLNLKGPRDILDRFKALCRADRRPYYDMLEILMDNFEVRDP